MMTYIALWLFADVAILNFFQIGADISPKTRALVSDWAPLIWLHPEDPFYPSSMDFYMGNSELRDAEENVVQDHPTPSTVLIGKDTIDYHFNTFEDLTEVNEMRSHFYGQALDKVQLNVLVKEWRDDCETVDVVYATFYPYNLGKLVCMGITVGTNTCLGVKKNFGNHVSDWEHTSIRFQKGQPTDIFLAAHTFGAKYAFVPENRTFKFYKGEEFGSSLMPQDTHQHSSHDYHFSPQKMETATFEDLQRSTLDKEKTRKKVPYPQTIYLYKNSNHPEVFSANGSHGTWASEGKHTYFDFVVHFEDYCRRGTPWRTWENMRLVDVTLEEDQYTGGDLQWLNYKGRWGNIKKLGCQIEPLVGECGLMEGVRGPGKGFGMNHFEEPKSDTC